MAILGVDPAWTSTNPSGVALLSTDGKLIAFAPSYRAFKETINGEDVDWYSPAKADGTIQAALEAAEKAAKPDLITIVSVDMPVSKLKITNRRAADNKVSEVFGGRWCGTHSPNQKCPGPVSENFSKIMTEHKFSLATKKPLAGKSYMEVYPHTALLRLMKSEKRLPYKQSKRSIYWPDLSTAERRQKLERQWRQIVSALEKKVGPINIPINDRVSLKAVEDALDAIICAWVGYEYANGRAESLGDDNSAIWTPIL